MPNIKTIQSLIDESLQAEQEARKDRIRSNKFSPSLFGRCYRAQYWNRLAEPESNPSDARTLRVFAVGKLFHEFVQRLFPDAQKEVRVETDDVLGFADIVYGDNVVDIKTVHSKSFWYAKRDGYDVNKEKNSNILQVMFYVHILKATTGRLVFISKDDFCIDEYGFHIDKWRSEVEKELETLRYYWSKQNLPPAIPRAYGSTAENPRECSYCSWKDKCFKMESQVATASAVL